VVKLGYRRAQLLRPLTARERATLECVARGITQKMIAFGFGISIITVGNTAANAYKKLGFHGAAAAVNAHRDAHSADLESTSDRFVSASVLAARSDAPSAVVIEHNLDIVKTADHVIDLGA
jgi:DNA-binding CsgD family transcriptional regulator